MKFTTTTIAASTLALSSALPQFTAPPAIPANTLFKVTAYLDGISKPGQPLQALKGGLRVGAPSQGAFCGPTSPDYAVFSLSECGDMYLYTPNPPQQLFVDRSGMGQGVIGYTTGVQPIGRNQERGPFAVTGNGEVVFADGTNAPVGFQACPNALGGGYSVWLQGVDNPAGNEGCKGFIAKAEKLDEAVKCSYS